MRAIILLLGLLTGCASHQTVLHEKESSRVHIEISSAIRSVNIELNGDRVFHNTNVRTVLIQGIEPGEYEIQIHGTASNRQRDIDYTETFTISENELHQIHLTAPPFTTSYYALTGLSIIGTTILTLLLID